MLQMTQNYESCQLMLKTLPQNDDMIEVMSLHSRCNFLCVWRGQALACELREGERYTCMGSGAIRLFKE